MAATLLCRPDDVMPEGSSTWRQHLVDYNNAGANPDRLLPAARLYSPPAYAQLLRSVGQDNLFVLSAGWGLVRADYLLPAYDITFAAAAERWQRRSKSRDRYHDFNHLFDAKLAREEVVYFFGGLDYLSLYYDLSAAIPARKVVYVAAVNVPKAEGFEYIDYGSKGTNWHYRCVNDFVAGDVPG